MTEKIFRVAFAVRNASRKGDDVPFPTFSVIEKPGNAIRNRGNVA